MASRGQMLVSLCLNKALRERFNNPNKRNKRKTIADDKDLDYDPKFDESGNSSSSCSDVDKTIQSENPEINDPPNENDGNVPAMNQSFATVFQSSQPDSNIASITIACEILEEILEKSHSIFCSKYTKNGTPRKRKRFSAPLNERKRQKLMIKRNKHNIKKGCLGSNCKLKCSTKIDYKRGEFVNSQYWNSDKTAREMFVMHNVERIPVKRRTVPVTAEQLKRNVTLKYYLKDSEGTRHLVCKTFFLATLGYNSHDDRFFRRVTADQNKQNVTQISK